MKRNLARLAPPLATLIIGILLGKSSTFSPTDAAKKPLTAQERAQQYLDEQRRKQAESKGQGTKLDAKLATGKDWKKFHGTADELLSRAFAIPGARDTIYFVYRALEEVDPAELPVLAAAFADQSSSRSWQPEAFKETLHRWAELDVNGAMAWAQTLKGEKRSTAMSHVLGGMAAQDPSGALELASGLTNLSERKDALYGIADVVTTTDPQRAMQILKDAGLTDGYVAIRQIFERWGTSDPATALPALIGLSQGQSRENAVSSLFNAWGNHDPASAMAAAAQLKPQESVSARKDVLHAWMQHDMAGSLAWFESLPAAERNLMEPSYFLGAAADQSPARATTLALSLAPAQRAETINNIARQLVSKDVDTALQWVQNLTAPQDQRSAWGMLGKAAAQAGPDKLTSTLAIITDPMSRKNFLEQVFSNADEHEPHKLMKLLQSMAPEDLAQAVQNDNPIYYPSQLDAAQTMKLLETLPTSVRSTQLGKVATGLAERDPDAALEWARQLPEQAQPNIIHDIFSHMASSDAKSAMDKALSLQNPLNRGQAFETVLSCIPNADASLQGLLSEVTGAQRDLLVSKIAAGKISVDPAAGADYLLDSWRAAPEDSAANLAQQGQDLGEKWATDDPQAASAWAKGLPDGELKNNIISGLTDAWLKQDPVATSAWINELPIGPAKDRAALQLVNVIRETDPESAVIWANQIQQASDREESLQITYALWFQRDARAASTSLSKLPLPEEVKRRIYSDEQ